MNGETRSTGNLQKSHLPCNHVLLNGRPSEDEHGAASMLDAASYRQDVPEQIMPIAVIGMSCRLPGGSTSPAKLWDMLANGRSGWSQTPADRFTQSSFQHPSSNVEGTVRE